MFSKFKKSQPASSTEEMEQFYLNQFLNPPQSRKPSGKGKPMPPQNGMMPAEQPQPMNPHPSFSGQSVPPFNPGMGPTGQKVQPLNSQMIPAGQQPMQSFNPQMMPAGQQLTQPFNSQMMPPGPHSPQSFNPQMMPAGPHPPQPYNTPMTAAGQPPMSPELQQAIHSNMTPTGQPLYQSLIQSQSEPLDSQSKTTSHHDPSSHSNISNPHSVTHHNQQTKETKAMPYIKYNRSSAPSSTVGTNPALSKSTTFASHGYANPSFLTHSQHDPIFSQLKKEVAHLSHHVEKIEQYLGLET